MAYKQILYPNLDNDPNHPMYIYQGGKILSDWYGWCLAVVAGSYGAKGSSYSAKTAWQSCNTKHYDRDIPEKVYTPLWYEGGTYGHVVIAYREGNQITVYSSPYTHKPNFEIFKGEINYILDYIGRVYVVGSYTGWSETVLESRVIELEEVKVEPTPEPEPSQETETPKETEPTTAPEIDNQPEEETININKENKEPMSIPTEDQQLIADIVEESSSVFNPSDKTKRRVYIIVDIGYYIAIMLPFISAFIYATTIQTKLMVVSSALTTTGTYWSLVFKLVKKKK